MEKRLEEALNGREDNYILPFYWQHGETEQELQKGMRIIREAGIRAVCVESRPHPDFLGPKWWADMDVILKEAEKLDMKVWVLDDAHFPTGYCNGRVAEKGPAAKRYLDHYTIDAPGPAPGMSFLIRLEEGETLLAVTAAKREGTGEELAEPVDLTERVRDGLLYWDVPEGFHRVTVIKSTWRGTGRPGYINTIDREAVRFFIDTVYEPHWAHYREAFGNTFAGFFSDEPELGNCVGEYGFHSLIGQPAMLLPWCAELEELSRRHWKEEWGPMLTALWSPAGGRERRARYEFMNMVTDLYGRNFCGQLADWCGNHGVEYIGHVIEDNGTHSHLGLGTGHYFKALWGQHMAGIDVVLQQIRPGYDGRSVYHTGGKGTYDGVFFHHGLAKLGSSLAQLDPRKQGRCMCEIFGAYGWAEGLKLMKWLADHMLVRGVNCFVPHAFTGKAFPDPDCPPHFYGQGNNPQYPYFKYLCDYMNRVCHLISGGVNAAQTAVLYTAESEWMGEFTPFEEIGRLLNGLQLDYQVVPMGILENGRIENGELRIGGACFRALVIPACERIPEELARWTAAAVEQAFPVLFAGRLPEVTASHWRQGPFFSRAGEARSDAGNSLPSGKPLPSSKPWDAVEKFPSSAPLWTAEGSGERLVELLESCGVRELRCEPPAPYLRYYHYRQEDGEFFLFFNEDPIRAVDTAVTVSAMEGMGAPTWYDAFDNCLSPVQTDGSGRISLRLEPGQARILCMEKEPCGKAEKISFPEAGSADISAVAGKIPAAQEIAVAAESPAARQIESAAEIPTARQFELPKQGWRLSLKPYNASAFTESRPLPKLSSLTGPEGDPAFSGTALYELEFDWDGSQSSALIDFGSVYETLEVRLNGVRQAVRIAPPYRCVLRGLRRGRNRLEAYVANTLVHSQRDAFSMTMPVEPSGLLGPVRLFGWEKEY